MDKYISSTEFRNAMGDELHQLNQSDNTVFLTVHGHVVGVLVSPERYTYEQEQLATIDNADITANDKLVHKILDKSTCLPWQSKDFNKLGLVTCLDSHSRYPVAKARLQQALVADGGNIQISAMPDFNTSLTHALGGVHFNQTQNEIMADLHNMSKPTRYLIVDDIDETEQVIDKRSLTRVLSLLHSIITQARVAPVNVKIVILRQFVDA